MPRTLKIAPDLDLPLDAVTRTIAVVGQKGTGKTSTAVVLTEEAAAAGAPFVVIDPTGAWFGLRSSAEGDGPGLDCIVFGGWNGDVPLEPEAGAFIARLVVEEGYSVVLDLEKMTKGKQLRFVAEFAEELYHRNRTARLVVMDEAHRFAPQAARGEERGGYGGRCLGAVTDVVTLGRRKGLGSVLISQRPSKINKDVFEQAEIMLVHRLAGSNDRKAINAWLDETGAPADMLGSLPNLDPRHAIAYAPAYKGLVRSIVVREKATFDSSYTPEVGETVVAPQGRAEVDLTALEKRMGDTLERQREEDPKHLRDQIGKLRDELAAVKGAATGEGYEGELGDLRAQTADAWDALRPLDPEATELVSTARRIAKRVLELEGRAPLPEWVAPRVDELVVAIAEIGSGSLRSAVERVHEVADQARRLSADLQDSDAVAGQDGSSRPTDKPGRAPREAPTAASPSSGGRPGGDHVNGGPPIKAGAVRALAMLYDAPRPLTRAELSTVAALRPRTFTDYLSILRVRGLIEEPGGVFAPASGVPEVIGRSERQTYSPQEIIARHKLKAGALKMLEIVMRAHPEGFTRAELRRLAGPAERTFTDYLSILRTRGLIEERAKRIYASPTLYLWQMDRAPA